MKNNFSLKVILFLLFAGQTTLAQQLIPFRKAGKWGYADANKKEVVTAKYEMVYGFYEGLSKVSLNGKIGYIDATGKEVIACQYEDGENFNDGLALVTQGGNKKFITPAGKDAFVADSKYTYLSFKEGLAICILVDMMNVNSSKFGLIDKTGKIVVSPKYQEIKPFSGGLAAVKLDNKWGFIDKTGKEIVSPKYKSAESFSEGLAAVENDQFQTGYVDATGKEVIACQYLIAKEFSGGFASTTKMKDGKKEYAIIDKTGKIAFSHQYDMIGNFNNNLAPFRKDGKWGYVNSKGKEVIPASYEWAYNFSEGLAAIKKGGKWGFIDEKGKEVIECKYQEIYGNIFRNGAANVKFNGYSGYISKTGVEYWAD